MQVAAAAEEPARMRLVRNAWRSPTCRDVRGVSIWTTDGWW